MRETPLYEVEKNPRFLQIRFGSCLSAIDRVSEETRRFLKNHGLDQLLFPVSLVMREALTNAVRHGHGLDPVKTVTFCIRLTADRLVMSVTDEGDGFDWQCHEGMPSQASEHGRGLAIMNEYFHECRYNKKGNHLELIYRLAPEDLKV